MSLENKIGRVLLVEENMDYIDQALELTAKQQEFYETIPLKAKEEINLITQNIEDLEKKLKLKEEKQKIHNSQKSKAKKETKQIIEDIEKNTYIKQKLVDFIKTQCTPHIDEPIEFELAINSKMAIDMIAKNKYDAVITTDLFNEDVRDENGKTTKYGDSKQAIKVIQASLDKRIETYIVSAPRGTQTTPNNYIIGSSSAGTTNIEYDKNIEEFAKQNNVSIIKASVDYKSRIATKNFEEAFLKFAEDKPLKYSMFLKTTPEKIVKNYLKLVNEQYQKNKK